MTTKKLAIHLNTQIKLVELHTILYFEADSNYTSIYFSSGEKVLVSKNLGHFEALLLDSSFVRMHDKYIVNFDFVECIQKGKNWLVTLSSGISLPVSQKRRDSLVKLLAG